MGEQKTYIAIDLKSFYASVECAERGLDPLTTNLVVADASRTEKTICLAVSPSLKTLGIGGRPRLFEVVSKVREINNQRRWNVPGYRFDGKSVSAIDIDANPRLEVDYITAVPRMALYIEYSSRIYGIYLKYIAPEDIHVYSIDEVFIDVTGYLKSYKMTSHELAMKMIRDVLNVTGITATAGIGTNMYLAKVAMDIVAKHIPADKDGVRIAELDELSYRKQLWDHTPLTSFWRVGTGTVQQLAKYGIYTMGQIARLSLSNEELFYKLFGVNAELLIDHAWGWEPCTIADIKAYKPESNSLGSGQVLQCGYDNRRAKVVTQEMADALALDLVDKQLVTNQIVLYVGYDRDGVSNPLSGYHGEVRYDHYGRKVPKPAHGSVNLKRYTSSSMLITEAVTNLFDKIVDRNLLIRRINVTANHVIGEKDASAHNSRPVELDMFTDYEAIEKQRKKDDEILGKERKLQEASLRIKKMFGKNALLKGLNFADGATAKERNNQIGGHKA